VITAAVLVPPQALSAIVECVGACPAWLKPCVEGTPRYDLTCAQSLELANLAASAEWECLQAAGTETADAAVTACRALIVGLEQAVAGMLLDREVIISDAWMAKDPDDDLERPMVHRGVITAVRTAPVLKLTLAADTGRTVAVDARMWTVTDRATRKTLYGPG
jgi:hypothetical protein